MFSWPCSRSRQYEDYPIKVCYAMILCHVDKSVVSACGACVSLGLASAALKFLDEHKDVVHENEQIKEMLKPILLSDVPPVQVRPSSER